MKWFTWLLLAFLFATVNSCTTLVNRRDLYSPEPAPDSLEAARQWYEENKEAVDAVNRMVEEDGFVFSDGARSF